MGTMLTLLLPIVCGTETKRKPEGNCVTSPTQTSEQLFGPCNYLSLDSGEDKALLATLG